MALVADYSCSSSSDSEDEDDAPQSVSKPVIVKTAAAATSSSNVKSTSGKIKSTFPNFFLDDDDEDEAEVEAAGSSQLGKLLPKPKVLAAEPEETSEEVGPIPPKKTYGDEPKPEPSGVSSSFNIQTKKVQGKVKIAAPSLKDFAKEDTTAPRRFIESSKKGSGLFAVLPQPKNHWTSASPATRTFLKTTSTTLDEPSATFVPSKPISSSIDPSSSSGGSLPKMSLIPDSLTRKRPQQSKLEEIRAKYLKKDANVQIVSRNKDSATSSSTIGVGLKVRGGSDESGDESGEDFFSLDSAVDERLNDPEALEKLKLPTPDFEQKVLSSASNSNAMLRAEQDDEEDADAASSSSGVTSIENVMKYVKPKKGKGQSEVNFIEVNADDLRPDSTEWLKNITDEGAVPVRRGKGLGGAQKRKNQITYLAFEAKAREQELQNTWSQNRASRRQTQMKYGF